MSSMKMYVTAAMLAGLILSAPFTANAAPNERGPRGGHHGKNEVSQTEQKCMPELTDEQKESLSRLHREHEDKIQPIREELWVKQTTLDALSGNAKVEPKEIRDLVTEMSQLRQKLYAERKAFAEKVKNDLGIDMPGAGGMHRGFGPGMHEGRGPGMHGKGEHGHGQKGNGGGCMR